MSTEPVWRLQPWVAVRVARWPLDSLPGRRAEAARHQAVERSAREAALQSHRGPLVEQLHQAVDGCTDRALRHRLLRLKRDVFNQRAICRQVEALGSLEGLASSISSELRSALHEQQQRELAAVETREAVRHALESAFDQALTDFADWVDNAGFRAALELDSTELAQFVDRWRATRESMGEKVRSPKVRELRRCAEVMRRALRGMLRTIPMAGYAGVGLLDLERREPERTPEDASGSTDEASSPWRATSRLHLGLLEPWRASLTDTEPREGLVDALPLEVTPWSAVLGVGAAETDNEPAGPPRVTFVTAEPSNAATHDPRGPKVQSLPLDPTVVAMLTACDGRPAAQVIAALVEEGHGEASFWRRVATSLLRVGLLLQPREPIDPGACGLRRWVLAQEAPGDAIESVASVLEGWPTDDAAEQQRRLAALRKEFRVLPSFCPVHVDLSWRSAQWQAVSARRPDWSPDTLRFDLEPLLRLAASEASDHLHTGVKQAFVACFGEGGTCDDVGEFVARALADPEIHRRLGPDPSRPRWMGTALGKAVLQSQATASPEAPIVRLPRALWNSLPEVGQHAFSVLCQRVVSATGEPTDDRWVVNKLFPGGGKYLSRYLGADGAEVGLALEAQRRRHACRKPVPVALSARLGLNFQLHPRLTEWTLAAPGEPAPLEEGVLSLDDLRLHHEPETDRLVVRSHHLDREIELVHLGFLRDALLPLPLRILRALSPRVADDAVPERCNLYDTLDLQGVHQGVGVPRFRPRLEVGRLVLERARWARPLAEVPAWRSKDSAVDHWERLLAWWQGEGLPERGFARVFTPGTPRAYGHGAFFDVWNPWTVLGLHRRRAKSLDQSSVPLPAWLLIEELLPAPEQAWTEMAGRAHASELLVELETGRESPVAGGGG